jgi:hypothetical protein
MVGDGVASMFAAEARRSESSATQRPPEGGPCARKTGARSDRKSVTNPGGTGFQELR